MHLYSLYYFVVNLHEFLPIFGDLVYSCTVIIISLNVCLFNNNIVVQKVSVLTIWLLKKIAYYSLQTFNYLKVINIFI